MEQNRVTPETLLRMATGFWPAQTLFVATDLGLFTALGNGAMTLDQLCDALKVERRAVGAILNACVALDLVEKQENLYLNSPVSTKFLIEGTPSYYGDFIKLQGTRLYSNWGKLNAAVRSGKPVGRFLDLIRSDPQYAQEFTRALFNNGVGPASSLANSIDFSQFKNFLDLGGGSGVYAIMLAKANPSLKGIVFDFPIVCEVASEFIGKHELSDQITVQPGDFFKDDLPQGVDFVLLSNVLHDIGLDDSRVLLKKISSALPSGGGVLIVEYVMNADSTGPVFPALFGLTMLIETDKGRVYSEEEIRSLLSDSGFVETRLIDLPGPSTAFFAVMP